MDREKVITEIEDALSGNLAKAGHVYNLSLVGLKDKALTDALALIKEQETEWEHLWDAPDGTFKGKCKKCGFVHFFIEGHDTQYRFCPQCGEQKAI